MAKTKKSEAKKTKPRKAREQKTPKTAPQSKKRIITIAVSLCLVAVLAVTGTLYFTVWRKSKTDINQMRYEVVPAVELLSSNRGSDASVSGIDEDVVYYSAYDDTTNYYMLYLGLVKSTPVSSNTAIWYDGKTPISISFSKSTVTEDSVQQSMETCISESYSRTDSFSASVNVGVATEAGALIAKTKVSLNVGFEYGYSREQSTGRSTTDTYATAKTNAEGLEEAISFTIGDNNEPVGKYRLALFATVDVYLYIELSRDNTKVLVQESLVSARESTYNYRIDYDSKEDGTFKKTSASDLIELNEDFLKQLKKPTDKVDTSKPPVVVPPTVKTETESLTATCLKHDSGYDTSKPENGKRHNQADPNGLQIIVNGCSKILSGIYKKIGNIAIDLKMLQGSGDQQWAVVSGSDKPKLNHDKEKNVKNTDIQGTEVGKGAYQVRVYYTDGTNTTKVAFNFMNGKSKGTTFNAFESMQIDSSKTINRVNIIVVYEIWHGSGFYSDWRASKTIFFS